MVIPAPLADLDAFNAMGTFAQHLKDGLPVDYRGDDRVNYRSEDSWVPEQEPWIEVHWADKPAKRGETPGLVIIQIWYDPLLDRFGEIATALEGHIRAAFFGCSNVAFPLLDYRADKTNPQPVEIDGDPINLYTSEQIPGSMVSGSLGKKVQKQAIQLNVTVYQWMASAA